jgi:hypothetical protein
MRRFKQLEIPDLNYSQAVKKPLPIRCIQIDEPFEVETMEGVMTGKKGDWLMVGIQGELYPCDREIFEKTYDLIKNND